MNKKLITLAVAAAMVAPAAAMADATLYGKLHQSIDYISVDDARAILEDDTGQRFLIEGKGFAGWTVGAAEGNIPRPGLQDVVISDADGNSVNLGDLGLVDPELADALGDLVDALELNNGPVGHSSRVGVKGSEDLGNGLKAIYQVEFGIRLSDGNFTAADGDRGSIQMRNTFVGLAGSFGTFLVGRHDTPLKISTGKLDLFADTIADYNGALGFNDVRADNAIAYISPNFSGFQLAGAVHAGGGATVTGGYDRDSDSIAEAYSIAGIYSNGPWYASLAYESLSEDMSTPTDNYDPLDTFTKWRVGLGILDWNGFSLTGIYEDRRNTGFINDQDSSSWEINAAYAFGNNSIMAGYGQLDRDNNRNVAGFGDIGDTLDDLRNGDLSQWQIAFDHNFSKRTKAYALYTNVDDDSAPNWDAFSLGMIHSF